QAIRLAHNAMGEYVLLLRRARQAMHDLKAAVAAPPDANAVLMRIVDSGIELRHQADQVQRIVGALRARCAGVQAMSDIRAQIAGIEHSIDADLRNLVRFGTQEQAEQATRTRETLRLAAMDQALASLESRNAAILALVSSLQAMIDELKRHPVGDALQHFREALSEGQLLLDEIQERHGGDANPAGKSRRTAPADAGPIPATDPTPSPSPALS